MPRLGLPARKTLRWRREVCYSRQRLAAWDRMEAHFLQRRDGVTAALSRGDQEAAELLRTSQMQLREALGYPVARPA